MPERFKKYPSIENHYRAGEITRWVTRNAGLMQATYVIQEKIHGANLQIWFFPKKEEVEIIFSSRKRILPAEENFYGLTSTKTKYEAELNCLANKAKELGVTIRLYGEYFGGGIQEGIDYGDEKKILFFDMMVNEEWISPRKMEEFFEVAGLNNLLVPKLALISSLEKALNVDCNKNSFLSPPNKESGTNIMEGVVIKPYNKVISTPERSVFRLKKKNEKFLEKTKVSKNPIKIDSTFLELQTEFCSYLTTNRIESVFSKHGKIEKPSQIGTYIKYIMDDAIEDFFKDNQDILTFSKKDRRVIFRTGGNIIAALLKEYL